MQTFAIGDAFHIIGDQVVWQTDDAVPVVVWSTPISEEKVVRVDIIAQCFLLDMSAGAAADFCAMFARRTGQNLVKVAQQSNLLVTTFVAPQPQLSINANPITQSLEIALTGKALPIRWHLDITVRETA